ncbi:alanine racemase [Limimonas halophila]|uniref:Alanine racemase n=1 Tax=Limimonas halophila TaxID=1082479 RepID=A0A1G7ME82_9PROT|nr:alanine racemase [Limimonas halophila]SDF59991.1 alanine racemase [Limimonas halophila]
MRAEAGPLAARAGGILHIDLDAIAANYRRLAREAGAAACGAAIKADAYGLGMDRVAPVLAREGADPFFVATIDEGLALRHVLTEAGFPHAGIQVLNGLPPDTGETLLAHGLTPVLNSLADIDAWRARARERDEKLPAALHVDTGMSRLGLPDDETARLIREPERLKGIGLTAVMSHLACADEPDHAENSAQLARFRTAAQRLPAGPRSLANSSGVFLGRAYHFDLVRPGAALYGINPTPGRPSPVRPVVRLRGRVLQVRQIDRYRGVGYGSTYRASRPTRVATVGVGYGDGYPIAVSNRGVAVAAGRRVPVAGRVSMDSLTLDITDIPHDSLAPGDFVDLLDDTHDVDALAAEAGTIGYEILTGLGARLHRSYHGGDG